jgi:hypothetical protein
VELIAGRFPRVEPRRRVGAYLRGLLVGLERKNGWTLAEHAGAVSPDGMQRLLRTATGMSTECVMTYADTSWMRSGTRARCGWLIYADTATTPKEQRPAVVFPGQRGGGGRLGRHNPGCEARHPPSDGDLGGCGVKDGPRDR